MNNDQFWNVEGLNDSWHGPEVARMVTKFESLQVYTHSDGYKHHKQHQGVASMGCSFRSNLQV